MDINDNVRYEAFHSYKYKRDLIVGKVRNDQMPLPAHAKKKHPKNHKTWHIIISKTKFQK